MPKWDVVGGGEHGGILVREGQAVGSAKLSERLATGAVVQELELADRRLHYRLVHGSGPRQGWVSTHLGARELVVPRRRKGDGARSSTAQAVASPDTRPRPAAWKEPPPEGSFRVGDFLWAGEAGLEQAPPCTFFPREWFGAVVLPPRRDGTACSLMLMGGTCEDDTCKNDVWQLSVPCLGISQELDQSGRPVAPAWSLVSAHDDGQVDHLSGRRLLRKWRSRRDFGCCAAPTGGGPGDGTLLYVAGGVNNGGCLGDVWASDDGGRQWVCMIHEAPWTRRKAPALHAVPGRAEHLLLAGGMASYAEVCTDAWTSFDAGHSWTRLESPPWSETTGRYRSAFLPLPHTRWQEARALLFGGCFVDGGEGGGQGLVGLERLMHDAWECRWDLARGRRDGAVQWVRWGWGRDERGPSMAHVGVESASATLEASTGTLIGRLPNRDFVSVGAAQNPELLPARSSSETEATMNVEWHQAELSRHTELVRGTSRSHDPAKVATLGSSWPRGADVQGQKRAGWRLVYVRMADAGPAAASRLVFVMSRGVLLSGAGELHRQLRFLALLGLRLERRHGMPCDLWRRSVLPLLLPEGPPDPAGPAS